MVEAIITVASVVAIIVFVIACVLFISLMMDKLTEGLGSSGLLWSGVGIAIGIGAGVVSGDLADGMAGWHIGGLVGATAGIGLVYLWQRLFRS